VNVKEIVPIIQKCTVFWNKMTKTTEKTVMFSLFFIGIKRKENTTMTIVKR
jgi:hypothetical protein